MIEASNLTKTYGSRRAIDGVSFSVGEGELVGLLGLNGAGKTTLMDMLAGCSGPTGGSVIIGGYNMAEKPLEAKRLIGYLPETIEYYNEMRVGEYLDYICGLKGIKRRRGGEAGTGLVGISSAGAGLVGKGSAGAKKEKRDSDNETRRTGDTHINVEKCEDPVARVCARVGLAGMERRMIRNLSKGYKQRVGFAQALLGDPKAVLLDEPTVGLDPSQLTETRALIKDLARTGAVIISSHILAEIQYICDRAIVLIDGKLAADIELQGLKSLKNNVGAADSTRGINAVNIGSATGSDLESLFLDLVRRQGERRVDI